MRRAWPRFTVSQLMLLVALVGLRELHPLGHAAAVRGHWGIEDSLH